MPPAPSLKSAQALSSDVARACREINALTDKIKNVDYEINGLTDQLKHAKRKAEECQIAIGQHLKTIKAARPDDWEDIVKAECNLGRTRAYELMAISGDTKTVEQTRAQTNIRKIKHRKSVRSGTDGGTLIAAIDEEAADSDAAGVTRPRRTKHESYLEGIRTLARTLEVMCGIPVPRFDLETFGGVIEAIHEVEAALSEFKEKVIREGKPAQEGDAAAPAEQPADVIEPDQRKLISVSRSSTSQAQIRSAPKSARARKLPYRPPLIRLPRPRFQSSPPRRCHGAVDDGTQTASIERCIQLIGAVRGHTLSLRGKSSANCFCRPRSTFGLAKIVAIRVISTMQIDDHRLREDAAGCWHEPELRTPGAAAQTRMVSVAGIRLDPQDLCDLSKG
jgi:hypothetical protein